MRDGVLLHVDLSQTRCRMRRQTRSGDEELSLEKEVKEQPVVQRHQMVTGSLARLLFIGLDLPLGSRAAASIGDEVL